MKRALALSDSPAGAVCPEPVRILRATLTPWERGHDAEGKGSTVVSLVLTGAGAWVPEEEQTYRLWKETAPCPSPARQPQRGKVVPLPRPGHR